MLSAMPYTTKQSSNPRYSTIAALKLALPLALISLACLPSNSLAQIEFSGLYPNLASIGETTTIQLTGKFPTWPIQVTSDRGDVSIQVEVEKSKLKVTVPSDAPQGIVWLRLLDEQSASKLIPLLIEQLPSSLEAEPNNAPTDAQSLRIPTVVSGRLEKSEDVDAFRVSVSRGERLVASLIAHEILRSPMDAVMQLTDLKGNVLLQSDDERGLDPQLIYDSPSDKELIVRVFAFPETPNSTIGFAGGKNFSYALRLTTAAYNDHFLPIVSPEGHSEFTAASLHTSKAATKKPSVNEPTTVSPAIIYEAGVPGWQWRVSPEARGNENASTSEATFFSGQIVKAGETNTHHLLLQASTKYKLRVHSRAFGFTLDSRIRVLDPEGKQVAMNDDVARSNYDAGLTITPKNTGEYEIQISDIANSFGPRHAYTLSVLPVRPFVELQLTSEQFVLKPGEDLTIPVSVKREGGFAEQVGLSIDGLPAGVTADSVTSEPKGDSSKSVKLKLTASDNVTSGHFPIRVFGSLRSPKSEEENQKADKLSRIYAEYSLRPAIKLSHLWLTIPPKKNSKAPVNKSQ